MPAVPQPRLLYFKKGFSPKGTVLAFHSHSFWQLEIDVQSRIEAEFHHGRVTVRPGEMLMIPPRVSHRFTYPETTHYVTLKFELEGIVAAADVRHFFASPFHDSLQSAMSRLLPSESLARPPLALVEPLLAVFAQLYFAPEVGAETVRAPTLVEKVERVIANRSGRGQTIKQLAQQLGFSANHISSEFQKATGETLKSYIDRRRKEQAEHLMIYSDLNVSQVADELAFPDVFSFSRFFKRHTGRSPIAYRKRGGE